MSWSFNVIGRAPAVSTKLAVDFNASKCAEPEQAIKMKLLDAAQTALHAYPENAVVKVEASGSQYNPHYPSESLEIINTFKIEITVLYGFVD